MHLRPAERSSGATRSVSPRRPGPRKSRQREAGPSARRAARQGPVAQPPRSRPRPLPAPAPGPVKPAANWKGRWEDVTTARAAAPPPRLKSRRRRTGRPGAVQSPDRHRYRKVADDIGVGAKASSRPLRILGGSPPRGGRCGAAVIGAPLPPATARRREGRTSPRRSPALACSPEHPCRIIVPSLRGRPRRGPDGRLRRVLGAGRQAGWPVPAHGAGAGRIMPRRFIFRCASSADSQRRAARRWCPRSGSACRSGGLSASRRSFSSSRCRCGSAIVWISTPSRAPAAFVRLVRSLRSDAARRQVTSLTFLNLFSRATALAAVLRAAVTCPGRGPRRDALLVLAALADRYRFFYGRWVARQYALADGGATPAVVRNDGVDFFPTPRFTAGAIIRAIAAAPRSRGPSWPPTFWMAALPAWTGGVIFSPPCTILQLVASVRHMAAHGRDHPPHLGRRAGWR